MSDWGCFPFGRPNNVRPARTADRSDAVVVGVYPSAWHVAWRAPENLVGEGQTGAVAALAVDVEPTVFWDGDADDFKSAPRALEEGDRLPGRQARHDLARVLSEN